MFEKPFSIDELCIFLHAAKSTIDQYNREGMPRFFVGKECRYIPSEVIDWLKRRCSDRVLPTEETFDPRKELLI